MAFITTQNDESFKAHESKFLFVCFSILQHARNLSQTDSLGDRAHYPLIDGAER